MSYDGLIEEILKHRPVYIVSEEKHGISLIGNQRQIIGVYLNYKSAVHCIFRRLFDSMDMSYYDPLNRYYKRVESVLTRGLNNWIDSWRDSSGVNTYTIEEWFPQQEKREVKYCNFDVWFKNRIIESSLTRSDVLKLLETYKRYICHDNIMVLDLTCTIDTIEWYSSIFDEHHRLHWFKIYGLVEDM